MKLIPVIAALACVSAGLVISRAQGPSGAGRVGRLLAQMTLAEKISMLHGAAEDPATSQGQPGFVPGVPRLGIPALRLVDGPNGVLTKVWSNGMTCTMGLAATFSRDDARQNGVVIGSDARALGQDIVLEPFLNLVRDFAFTRAWNTYGEDPLLTGQIGAALVTGIQSRGVMAAAKHYTAFDGATDVFVDPQTFHEIYLAPFTDAVEAGIASVLCSSNQINGRYSCGSGATLNGVLRTELGFKGFVIPDFEGTHSTLYLNEGLDLEMPGAAEGVALARGGYFRAVAVPPIASSRVSPARNPDEAPMGLLRAIETGQVSEATITAAAGRILGQMERFGYLDRAPGHVAVPEDYALSMPILRRTAEDAAVLLMNRDNILPLTSDDLASAVFIGPGAGQIVAIGLPGGKGAGIPSHQTGPVEAIRQITGKTVSFSVANDMTGAPVPASALSHNGMPGLARGQLPGQQIDSQLDFTSSNGKALPAGSSWTWTGSLTAPEDGAYMIAAQALGAAVTVTLDGQSIARTSAPSPGRGIAMLHPNQDNVLPTTDGLDNARNVIALKTGAHDLTVTANGEKAGNPVQVRLAWMTPRETQATYDAAIHAASDAASHAASDAAKRAGKVVVFAWGRDRPDVFRLAGEQDKLIADIAAVNANTIVVLNTSMPVAMPWLGKVKAVVQMWWPGDQGGPATADILLGRANPAGRLPFTWPAGLDQMLANDPAHPERSNKGVDGKTTYSEGIFMGYRWFDRQQLTPLFPFGHGLSYSAFAYSRLRAKRAVDGGLDVTVTIHNAGKLAGDEVPQVYLGPPAQAPDGPQFAVRALAAFERVRVDAGKSKDVTLHVPLRHLQYWSASGNRWTTAGGNRTVFVGASSRDTRLSAGVNIAAR